MSELERDRAARELALREQVAYERGHRGATAVRPVKASMPIATVASYQAAPRTFGGTMKRAAKVFSTILGTLGAVALGNALTAGGLNAMFGLVPRTGSGAWGILLHPFLHANSGHLAVNAVGIVLMGGTVFLRSERDFWRVTVLGTLVGGGATWLVGRPAVHVGASGVLFAYLGYLLTTGWFDRKPGSVALSLGAAALWGSALFGLSPLQSGISWELHAFGLAGGVIAAWWRRGKPAG